MEDRCLEVLKQYFLKVYNIYRARGAYLLETDKGLKLLKCLDSSRNRVIFEHIVKEHLYNNGYYNTDLYVKTIKDDIIAEDQSGCQYIVKDWFWGEECNLKELTQIEMAAANLARLHNALKGVKFTPEQLEYNITDNLKETFEKRSRELKRVRGYVRDKRQKNEFEVLFLNLYDDFYEQGVKAIKRLANSQYKKVLEKSISQNTICHGNYTYHNIIMLKNKNEAISKPYVSPGWVNRQPLVANDLSMEWSKFIATTNFDKSHVGIQITDLYHFIRKVMEKNDWDIIYGSNIIEAYDRIKPISKDELEVLYLLLLYPEKFWKITNYYYNGKKSWISGRNIQKLSSIGEQNPKKEMFLSKLESII